MRDKVKIILDVDTGTDDAVAIMAGILSKDIDLVAVCSVHGNQPLHNTTENSLRVVQAMGSDVPVYRGCPRPLVKDLVQNRIPDAGKPAVVIDGQVIQTHPAYLDLPASAKPAEDMPAVSFYVDYLRNAKEPVTLVPVGSLTNIAAALIVDPSIVKNIEQIVIMGGGHDLANHSPTAEFNIWADPEAAQWVIHCGADIVLVPLDATETTAFDRADAADFRALGTFAGKFAADLIEHRITVGDALHKHNPPGNTAVHDALAIMAAVDRSLLTDLRRVHCDIGLGDFAEGATLINASRRFYVEESDKNVWFAFKADKERYKQMLLECFKA